jgi:hypothetical protein
MVGLVMPSLTFRTDTKELQAVAKNLVTAPIFSFPPGKVKRRCGNIVHLSATHAPQVVVPKHISVESGLAAREIELLNRARPSQHLQIAIHRAQTNFGYPASDNLVKARGRGMTLELLELLQNHLPLPRIPLGWFHCTSPTAIDNYYCLVSKVNSRKMQFWRTFR